MNKNKKIVVALVALVFVISGIFVYRKMGQDKGDKEVQIIMKVENNTIYDKTVDTNAGTLADLLKEMKEDKEIQMEYEDSGFGMFITGLGSDEIYSNDESASKYWVYNSSNNKQCVEAGFCDSADSLKIQDKDVFEFELIQITK